MSEILTNIVATIAIITFVAGVVAGITKYIVVNPLQTAINALNDSVKEFKKMLDSMKLDQQGIDKRLIVVEQSSKSAHHRLDKLEG
ncbi:Sec-independent protein translocase protein TatA [Sporomusaceae bacterium BoRhaA]|uniref:hypothetical protein n=1 Tax=Pelorhabdus rhamnosifermentans TaxID=2772457 RepID=UPI001C061381|nr:hypothetical protein [Pelorhabdus rhamnosifermentans]MBU2701191.1 Sec-independent protein translocase protein TatA [Pelorhabdus rhamnosifermentans]